MILLCEPPDWVDASDKPLVPRVRDLAAAIGATQFRVPLHYGGGPFSQSFDSGRAARFSAAPSLLVDAGTDIKGDWSSSYPSWSWKAAEGNDPYYQRHPEGAVIQRTRQGCQWLRLLTCPFDVQLSKEPRDVAFKGGKFVDGGRLIDRGLWTLERATLRTFKEELAQVPVWSATMHGGFDQIVARTQLYADNMDLQELAGVCVNAYPNWTESRDLGSGYRAFVDDYFGRLKGAIDAMTGGLPVRIVESAAVPMSPAKLTHENRVTAIPDLLDAARAAGFASVGLYGGVEKLPGAPAKSLRNWGAIKRDGSMPFAVPASQTQA